MCTGSVVMCTGSVVMCTGSVVMCTGSVVMCTGSVVICTGSVVVCTGSVVICTGSVVMSPGSVVVCTGSVVMSPGSVVVCTGSVVMSPGSVVVCTGSVVMSPGSVVVCTGSVVVCTGSVVMCTGSVVMSPLVWLHVIVYFKFRMPYRSACLWLHHTDFRSISLSWNYNHFPKSHLPPLDPVLWNILHKLTGVIIARDMLFNTVKREMLVAIKFGGFENITIWQRFNLAILLEESWQARHFFHLVIRLFFLIRQFRQINLRQ